MYLHDFRITRDLGCIAYVKRTMHPSELFCSQSNVSVLPSIGIADFPMKRFTAIYKCLGLAKHALCDIPLNDDGIVYHSGDCKTNIRIQGKSSDTALHQTFALHFENILPLAQIVRCLSYFPANRY